jgi:hypothetical protein
LPAAYCDPCVWMRVFTTSSGMDTSTEAAPAAAPIASTQT